MGHIISKMRILQTKKDLTHLNMEIRKLERDSQYKEEAYVRMRQHIRLIFWIIFFLLVICYYYFIIKYDTVREGWVNLLIYASPFVALPIFCLNLRSVVSWYYEWTLKKNKGKLQKLKQEKQKILQSVKETERYQDAKEILDNFEDSEDDSTPLVPSDENPGKSSSSKWKKKRSQEVHVSLL